MHQYRTLRAALASLSICALGCSEDVGTCDDPQQGRDTVLLGGSIQFGGQAIINASCAPCHGSGAQGAIRQGAPEGLDFDLFPVDAEDPAEATVNGNKVVLTPSALSRLRGRQRQVFEDRNVIYDQVVRGLMPPDGIGATFRAAVTRIFDSSDEAPCTQGVAYGPTTSSSSQKVLRNWLACGAPIVETTSPLVLGRTAGSAGYQYPTCGVVNVGDGGIGGDGGMGGDGGGGGNAITIEQVQMQLFETTCSTCHSEKGGIPPDLGTADASYNTLVVGMPENCSEPYVTKGDPTKSFLYELVSVESPVCGTRPVQRMPPTGVKLSTSQLKLIQDWITQGALRESDL